MRLAWKYAKYVNFMLGNMNLWNNLGFSLYTILSVCYIVITSDE